MKNLKKMKHMENEILSSDELSFSLLLGVDANRCNFSPVRFDSTRKKASDWKNFLASFKTTKEVDSEHS